MSALKCRHCNKELDNNDGCFCEQCDCYYCCKCDGLCHKAPFVSEHERNSMKELAMMQRIQAMVHQVDETTHTDAGATTLQKLKQGLRRQNSEKVKCASCAVEDAAFFCEECGSYLCSGCETDIHHTVAAHNGHSLREWQLTLAERELEHKLHCPKA